MKEEQKLPEWFNGTVYKEGLTVENRFKTVSPFISKNTGEVKNTGEEYELNNIELSMYDMIMGAILLSEMGMSRPDIIKDLQRGLDWFRENNKEAYKILFE
jgi:hypothetical protein